MALLRNRSVLISLLLFLLISFFQLSLQQPICHEFERLALMQFKNNFLIKKNASRDPLAYPKVDRWKFQDSNCCSWEGITCDQHTGRVISMDLSSNCLFGSINSSSSLFRLDHLQYLNLADNDFHFSEIPSALGNLSRLTYLNLSESLFSGQIPFEISKLSKLTMLDLSWNTDYSGNQGSLELKTPHWKSLIQNLSRLEHLHLSFVNINSPIPSALANLSSLTYLGLSHCGLLGKFPNTIFEFSKLEKLFVHANWGLTGILPEFHSSIPLKKLRVSNTNFFGEFPKSLGLLSSLEYLDVANCNFSGVLPSSFSNLTKLCTLNLGNNSFEGSGAPFFPNLTQLEYVDLSSNHFTFVKIPSLTRSTYLQGLDISRNQISGPFPSWLTNLTQLTYLNLADNMIHGSLPSSISKLKNLELFYLGPNKLSGMVELDTFFELKNLKYLSLSHNSFSLLTKNSNNSSTNNTTIPKFVNLQLGSCNLKEFPAFLHNQNQLELLILADNKIHGQVPKWLLKMSSKLLFFDLSHNSLTSFEDSSDSTLPSSLVYLDVGFNFFRGSLPIPPPSVYLYSAVSNSFEGEIPLEFCNMTSLQYLDLSRNNLSGIIPQCLGNQTKSLSNLKLEKNNFRGKIPRSLADCRDLVLLDLSSNQIRDTFPLWLGVLPHLKIIILQSNEFYGAIDGGSSEFDTMFPELRIIDLSHNRFQGPLPLNYFQRWNVLPNLDDKRATYLDAKYGNSSTFTYSCSYSITVTNKGKEMTYAKILNIFTAIDLSCNNFSGAIPQVVGNLRKLELLNLSNNALDGLIPPALGNLSNLEALDLSNNNLTGRIPAQLAQLTFLEVFNVSNNLLTGSIPQGSQFATFENSSFQGNPGLCGMPLFKKCGRPPPPPSSSKEDGHTSLLAEIGWKAVLIGIGCGFIGGVALGIKVFAINQEWLMETFLVRHGRQRRSTRQIR